MSKYAVIFSRILYNVKIYEQKYWRAMLIPQEYECFMALLALAND